LLETKAHDFCTEASDLGWRPGQWPVQFVVPGLGNGMPFQPFQKEISNGDLMYIRYQQANGIIVITVFND
jgi:hypothetical protein